MISFARIVLLVIGVMAVGSACSSGPSQADKRAAVNGQAMPTYYLTPAAMVIIASDANGDAVVSRDEFTSFMIGAFVVADTDANGMIRPTEYAVWSQQHLGRRDALPGFLGMDVNQDDNISTDEFEERFNRVFTLHDSDDDGQITRTELVKLLQRPQLQNRAQGVRQGGMPSGGGRRPPM